MLSVINTPALSLLAMTVWWVEPEGAIWGECIMFSTRGAF